VRNALHPRDLLAAEPAVDDELGGQSNGLWPQSSCLIGPPSGRFAAHPLAATASLHHWPASVIKYPARTPAA
jgi:hypothetical protein